MIGTLSLRRGAYNAEIQARRNLLIAWLWGLAYLGAVAVTARHLLSDGIGPSTIAWLFFWIGIGAICYAPRLGVYLTVGLTLAGDMSLLPWYPFTKNLSSYESLLFLSNAAIVNPAEVYMALTMGSWLLRPLFRRSFDWRGGPLFWPLASFTAFVAFGLGYGLSRGGDMTIALWESRAIFYIPLMYLLVVNLVQTSEQVNRVVWAAMIGIIVKAIAGVWYVATVLKFDLSSVERIAEHPASIHFDSLIVLALAVWIYRGSTGKRIVLTLTLPMLLFSLFANQRRASFLVLAIAVALMAVVLFRERRLAFFLIVPPLALIFAVYCLAFWGSTSPIAMPARAIRSVVDSSGGNARDQASNLYRILENINTMATIKAAPLTGVGFGNKFIIVVPMADISSFVWWEYITHNSVMWIWMKTGLGGFASMIFVLGSGLMIGGRAVWRMPANEMGAIALSSTLYLVMHFVFAYVDMSWSIQNMVYVGTTLGILAVLEPIVAAPAPRPARRWPWQPVPPPPPGLREL